MAKTKTVLSAGTDVIDDKDALRKAIITNLENIESEQFSLAVNLYKCHHEEAWAGWGYTSFRDYVEKELPIEYRVACYHRDIGESMTTHGIKQKEVDKIGAIAFREVSKLLKPDTPSKEVDKLLSYAQKHTAREVADFVRKERIKRSGGKAVSKLTLKFSLTDEQGKVVESALAMAMEQYGTDNPNLAIEAICMEYQMNHDPSMVEAVKSQLHDVKEAKAPHKKHSNKGKKAAKKGGTRGKTAKK